MKYFCLLLSILTCFMACHQEKNNNKDKVLFTTSDLSDSITVRLEEPKKMDSFATKINDITPLMSQYGFERKEEKTLTDNEAYLRHWWLKKYRNRMGKQLEYPGVVDFSSVAYIRQFHFVKKWHFVIEEWTFKHSEAAIRWKKITRDAYGAEGNYFLEKPPNVHWMENEKLYFIMGSAAQDWFAHSEDIILKFTGKTKGEIKEMIP